MSSIQGPQISQGSLPHFLTPLRLGVWPEQQNQTTRPGGPALAQTAFQSCTTVLPQLQFISLGPLGPRDSVRVCACVHVCVAGVGGQLRAKAFLDVEVCSERMGSWEEVPASQLGFNFSYRRGRVEPHP